MSYQTVVNMTLNAYTLEECIAAETSLTYWLADHPEDLGLHEIAGQLGIVKAAALEREGDRQGVRRNASPLTATTL